MTPFDHPQSGFLNTLVELLQRAQDDLNINDPVSANTTVELVRDSLQQEITRLESVAHIPFIATPLNQLKELWRALDNIHAIARDGSQQSVAPVNALVAIKLYAERVMADVPYPGEPDADDLDTEPMPELAPAADEKPKRKPADFWSDVRLVVKYGGPVVLVLGVVFLIGKVIAGMHQAALEAEVIQRPTPMDLPVDMGIMYDFTRLLSNVCIPPLIIGGGIALFFLSLSLVKVLLKEKS